MEQERKPAGADGLLAHYIPQDVLRARAASELPGAEDGGGHA